MSRREPVLLVCHGCRVPLAEPDVCPLCVRPSCADCLTVGGCAACLPTTTPIDVAALEAAVLR